MERGTYIKLFRKFKNWKWYKHPVTKSVFLHLLIEAQWNDRFVHGVKLERGQILTTENDLADELGLSRQQVRTAIGHLTSTNEITKEIIKVSTEGLTNRATNRMTLITVENYSLYQMGALVATEDITELSTDQSTSQSTDQQPSLNQTSYYINNDNKEYKDINNSACARARGDGNDEEGMSKAMRDVMMFRRMCEENDRD